MTEGDDAPASWLESHRILFGVFVAVFVLFFGGPLLRGEVVSPHPNDVELGLPSADPASSRHRSDFSSQYIPRLHQQMNGDYAGWLATWDPYTELGRPISQGGGYSPVFPTTRILMWLYDDPLYLYTTLVISTLLLTGAFAFMYLREIGLHPVACLTGALGLALSCRSSYWLGSHQFHVPICGVMVLLWLCVRYARSGKAWLLLPMAFTVYCMLLAGRLQMNVLLGYVFVPVLMVYLMRELPDWSHRFRVAGAMFLAALAGALAVVPVYLDLYVTAAASARLGIDEAHFLGALPALGSASELARYLAGFLNPFLLGDPLQDGVRFNGTTLGPLLGSLAVAGLFVVPRRTAAVWAVMALIFAALAASETLFRFAVHHLGLSLSRGNPLLGAFLPLLVLGALAVDELIRRPSSTRASLTCGAVLLVPAVIALSLGLAGPDPGWALDGRAIALTAASLAGIMIFAVTRQPLVIVVLSILGVFAFSRPLIPMLPRDAVHSSSPLTEAVARAVGPRHRYAKVGTGFILPSNQERQFGARSIHAYDSLSSTRYQRLARQLSARGTFRSGRHFDEIDAAYVESPAMSFTGVNTLLSGVQLESPSWRRVEARPGGANLLLYQSVEPPLLFAQIPLEVRDDAIAIPGSLAEQPALPSATLRTQDDASAFRVTAHAAPTLLFVSQQYHAAWKAQTADGAPLKTIPVNDFYLGVALPPGSEEVHLRFDPWVRWMWIPQATFVALFGLWIIVRIRARRSYLPTR